jgi:predicted MFS family arabinose efflux permease
MAVYLATFFLTTYEVPYQQLALALLMVTLGNLAGNVAGSRLADRAPSREGVFAGSLVLTAALSVPLLLWTPGLGLSIVLGFLYTFANAVGRPSLMASLSDVPEAVRGSVLGLNVTFASVGWIAAAAVGGWLIATTGFGGLGLFCASVAVLGALLVGIGVLAQGRRTLNRRGDQGAPAPAGG